MIDIYKIIFWGDKLNFSFCEGKYYKDTYICEPVNAFTSLWMCLLSLICIFNRKYIGKNIQFLYILQFICGIGSALFHLSLHKGWQCVDEMSMILLVVVGYKMFNDKLLDYYMNNNQNNISNILNILYTSFLTSYGMYTLIICAIDPNPKRFRDLFTAIFMVLIFQVIGTSFIINNSLMRKHIINMFYITVTGALCWVFDEFLCNAITYRLYLHSFWHIFIGISTVYLIEFLLIFEMIASNKIDLYYIQYILKIIPVLREKNNIE